MPVFNLADVNFATAVRKIERRAERQKLEEKLTECFVPNRVLEQLDTTQNQLLFGRRGVGKTHTLQVYLSSVIKSGGLCHYLDCTPFSSGLIQDGGNVAIAIRCFSKMLVTLFENLLDDIAAAEQPESSKSDQCQSILESLFEIATPSSQGEPFDYTAIARRLNQLLDAYGSTALVILIDEWAAIPRQSQPYFAELLKRTFFSNLRTTLKIAVVDYAYCLGTMENGALIGLEKSADIFSDIRMDKYFVWDQDEEFVRDFFAGVLYNHLGLELGLDIDIDQQDKTSQVVTHLFTQTQVLDELCRASEGSVCQVVHIRFSGA